MLMLNYLWRLLATAFSFATFGAGGLFLSCLVFPAILFLTKDKKIRRERIRFVISRSFGFFFKMMVFLGLFRLTIIGEELVKSDKGCLIISNHPSLVDVISLISLYPNSCCIVKKELWRNPFLGGVVSAAGYIRNDQVETILEQCKTSIDQGEVIIIFPEGTRTIVGKEMILQRGAAHIALRLNCPIRTIQIRVNPTTLTKAEPWYSIPTKRAEFVVEIKDILDVSGLLDKKMPISLAARKLTRLIKENIDADYA